MQRHAARTIAFPQIHFLLPQCTSNLLIELVVTAPQSEAQEIPLLVQAVFMALLQFLVFDFRVFCKLGSTHL